MAAVGRPGIISAERCKTHAAASGLIYDLSSRKIGLPPQHSPSTHQLMHRTLFNRYSSITVLISVALLTSLACMAGRDTEGTLVVAAPPQGVIPAASSTPSDSITGSK